MSDCFRKEIRFLKNAMVASKPSIIHAHWTYEYALAALKSDLPYSISVRDWAPRVLRLLPDKPYRLMRLFMNNRVFKKARFMSANSYYIQQEVLKRWKRDIPIIPNALKYHNLPQQPSKQGEDALVIAGIASGLGKLKNATGLLQAFDQVRQAIPSARLILIGRNLGPKDEAAQWARHKGIDKGVEFAGFMEHTRVIEKIATASMYVHPSLEESFGNPLIEAMSQKIPCIGGKNSGSIPWVLDFGDAGMLVDVTNPSAIASGILTLWNDKSLRETLAEKGYQRFEKYFKVEPVLKMTLEHYEDVLNQW